MLMADGNLGIQEIIGHENPSTRSVKILQEISVWMSNHSRRIAIHETIYWINKANQELKKMNEIGREDINPESLADEIEDIRNLAVDIYNKLQPVGKIAIIFVNNLCTLLMKYR